jgi:hypothetical protein
MEKRIISVKLSSGRSGFAGTVSTGYFQAAARFSGSLAVFAWIFGIWTAHPGRTEIFNRIQQSTGSRKTRTPA